MKWLRFALIFAALLALCLPACQSGDEGDTKIYYLDDDDDNDDDDMADDDMADDDMADDDDDTVGDDDTANETAYDQCVQWAETCGFSSLETGAYCGGLEDLDFSNPCVLAAVDGYLNCLMQGQCDDFGEILGCLNGLGEALIDC